MNAKTNARRDVLRTALTDIAERQITAQGLASLKARSLAAEADCSVGAIYNVFDDLVGLTIAVNGRTFRRLGMALDAAIEATPDATPQKRLVILSQSYLAFASDNENLWRCLFDLSLTRQEDLPEWYLKAFSDLFSLISDPLQAIFTDMSEEDIALMTRALFSSVHGIVLLGLEQRLSGVPLPQIERMIELVLMNLTSRQGIS